MHKRFMIALSVLALGAVIGVWAALVVYTTEGALQRRQRR